MKKPFFIIVSYYLNPASDHEHTAQAIDLYGDILFIGNINKYSTQIKFTI